MPRAIDPVEIQEPPLQELRKRRSCLKRTCVTGCGCIVFFLIVVAILFRMLILATPETVETIPTNFPESIPVYDTEHIHQVLTLSGERRGRAVTIASIVPKILLTPIFMASNDAASSTTGMLDANQSGWDEFVSYVQTPVADKRDVVQIEWRDLGAAPSFLIDYYKRKLEEKGFRTKIAENARESVLTFSGNNIDGTLRIVDDSTTRGSDIVTLTVSIP